MRKGLWLVTSAISLGVIQGNLFATDTGWKSPTTYDRCKNEWSNSGGACDGVNGEYAAGGRVGDLIQTEGWGGFNFNIPSNATITGIGVRAYYRLSSNQDLPVWNTLYLSWNTGCEHVTDLFIYAIDTTWQWDYTDVELWGRNWTPDELSNTNFTCGISAHPETPRQLWVDSLQVIVYYTTPTPTPTPTPVNLICNPSFEADPPTDWTKIEGSAGSKIFLYCTDVALDGVSSCRFADPTSDYSARAVRSNYAPITAGEDYNVSGWYYLKYEYAESVASETHYRFRVEWWDSNWNFLSWYPSGNTGITCAAFNTWTQVSYDNVVAPQNAAYMTLRNECREDVNWNNDLYIDNFFAAAAN